MAEEKAVSPVQLEKTYPFDPTAPLAALINVNYAKIEAAKVKVSKEAAGTTGDLIGHYTKVVFDASLFKGTDVARAFTAVLKDDATDEDRVKAAEAGAAEVASLLTYADDLKTRAGIQQNLRREVEGPDKALETIAKGLVKLKGISIEKARALARMLAEADEPAE